jgi:hypothetical protein
MFCFLETYLGLTQEWITSAPLQGGPLRRPSIALEGCVYDGGLSVFLLPIQHRQSNVMPHANVGLVSRVAAHHKVRFPFNTDCSSVTLQLDGSVSTPFTHYTFIGDRIIQRLFLD